MLSPSSQKSQEPDIYNQKNIKSPSHQSFQVSTSDNETAANINPKQNYFGHPFHCLSLDNLKRPIRLNPDTHILSKLGASRPVDPFSSLS